MKNIYNIKCNFQKELLNFYEWKKEDNIKRIKSINCYKLSNEDYYNIIKYNIKNSTFKNTYCLFCNDFDTICINFDEDGNSCLRSKLLLEDEVSVLDTMIREKTYKFDYKKCEKIKYSFYSREEKKKISLINTFFETNKNNKDIIDYLSYEWYGKIVKNNNRLITDINNAGMDKINKIYETIELIN